MKLSVPSYKYYKECLQNDLGLKSVIINTKNLPGIELACPAISEACNDLYWAIGKKWHAIISITSRCSTIELSRQLYFILFLKFKDPFKSDTLSWFCGFLLMKFLRCASSKFFFTSANLKSANFYKILHNFVSKQFWNSSLYTFYIYKFELGHSVLYL